MKRSFFQHLIHVILRKPGLIRRFKVTKDILGNVKNKNILDVGCGSGIYSIYFAKKGAKATGIDFSSAMINLANKNSRKENCEINLINLNFLDYEERTIFDYLLFIGVFDYVDKDKIPKYFEKAINLTEKKIIATFPKKFAFQTIIRYIWLKRQNCAIYFFTKKQIKRIAEQFDLFAKFNNCGPIWTVEFIKKI